MPDPNVAECHAAALAHTGAVVARIRPDQMSMPTPCAGWDVRALLNHVVSGNWWAVELATGRTIAEVGDRLDGDVVGDDPRDTYEASADAAAAVFRVPGALERPCAVSYGPVPGSVYCGHRFVDVLVHGWDLARATGQPSALPPDLVDACMEVVVPQADLLAGSGMFGTTVPVAKGAGAETRLLGMLGRHN